MFSFPRRAAALLVIPVSVCGMLLAACGSSSGTTGAAGSSEPSAGGSASASAPSGPKVTSASGVQASAAFGSDATLVIPHTAAPAELTQQTLTQGSGTTIAKGDTIVANYVGETWAEKDGKVNVFDSSFSRGTPAPFPIGVGHVVPGWDTVLVGKRLGSRVLMTLPPADGYGSKGNSGANIASTDTLVFLVDLIQDYKPDASAPGTAVADVPTSGWPTVVNTVGKQPQITSVAGVKEPDDYTSTLLVKGSGPAIDSKKTLMLQIVQTDLATGKNTTKTWGTGVQAVPASTVFQVAGKLSGQNIGARALVLVPQTVDQSTSEAQPAQILVIDVVGQF